MSDASRNYQKFVAGAEDGMVYKVNGVNFDGFKDGVLMEAKGNYFNFVNKGTGEFQSWFNDEISMNAVKELLKNKDIKGIEFILKPMK